MKKQFSTFSAIIFFLISAFAFAHLESAAVKVIITDKGFNPNYIVVNKGDTVTWLNGGVKEHWPASNFHPTHTAYPGSGIDKCSTGEASGILDACRGLAGGESYSFTFDRAGQWGIHDHLAPENLMTVKAVGDGEDKKFTSKDFFANLLGFLGFGKSGGNKNKTANASQPSLLATNFSAELIYQEAVKINSECLIKNREICYEEKFKALTRAKGLFFAEQTLYRLWGIDVTTRRCHVLSHVIASEATRQNPQNWKKYLENVDYVSCSAGFLHGIMEAHIGDDPNFKLNPEFINGFCLSKGDYYKKQNCVHYTGHLLMSENGGNVNLSLGGCEGINEGLYRRCYTGVFMEDSFPLALVDHGIRPQLPNRRSWRFVKTQIERCLQFSGDRGVACWTDMGENFGVFYNDPQKVYNSCFEAPTKEEGTQCFLKAAGLFAIHPEYSSPDKLVGICKFVQDKNLYKSCVGRMISSLLYYSPKFIDRGVSLCSNTAEWYKKGCFSELNKLSKEIVTETGDKKEFCWLLPDNQKEFCLD